MSRLRLIETEKFLGCRDRDSSRPGNLMDVETETPRDWAKDTQTPSRLLLISDLKIQRRPALPEEGMEEKMGILTV